MCPKKPCNILTRSLSMTSIFTKPEKPLLQPLQIQLSKIKDIYTL